MSIASFKVNPLLPKKRNFMNIQPKFIFILPCGYRWICNNIEISRNIIFSLPLHYRVNVIINIVIIMISPVSENMVILLWFRNCLYIFHYLFYIVSCIFNDFIIFFLWFDIVAIHWYYHLVYITWVCLYCLFVVCLNYYTVLPMNDQFII